MHTHTPAGEAKMKRRQSEAMPRDPRGTANRRASKSACGGEVPVANTSDVNGDERSQSVNERMYRWRYIQMKDVTSKRTSVDGRSSCSVML